MATVCQKLGVAGQSTRHSLYKLLLYEKGAQCVYFVSVAFDFRSDACLIQLPCSPRVRVLPLSTWNPNGPLARKSFRACSRLPLWCFLLHIRVETFTCNSRTRKTFSAPQIKVL
jgi:hypothetical protein